MVDWQVVAGDVVVVVVVVAVAVDLVGYIVVDFDSNGVVQGPIVVRDEILPGDVLNE